jgi:hypothetical protein
MTRATGCLLVCLMLCQGAIAPASPVASAALVVDLTGVARIETAASGPQKLSVGMELSPQTKVVAAEDLKLLLYYEKAGTVTIPMKAMESFIVSTTPPAAPKAGLWAAMKATIGGLFGSQQSGDLGKGATEMGYYHTRVPVEKSQHAGKAYEFIKGGPRNEDPETRPEGRKTFGVNRGMAPPRDTGGKSELKDDNPPGQAAAPPLTVAAPAGGGACGGGFSDKSPPAEALVGRSAKQTSDEGNASGPLDFSHPLAATRWEGEPTAPTVNPGGIYFRLTRGDTLWDGSELEPGQTYDFAVERDNQVLWKMRVTRLPVAEWAKIWANLHRECAEQPARLLLQARLLEKQHLLFASYILYRSYLLNLEQQTHSNGSLAYLARTVERLAVLLGDDTTAARARSIAVSR